MSITKRLGFLMAFTLVAGFAHAQSQQAIRDQIFGATDAIKKQADDLNARMLAPEAYANGQELYVSASDTMAKGRDLERVREELAEASSYFTKSVEASKLAQTTFTTALAARQAAERAEGAKYAQRDWQRAEQALMSAAETLEGGNLNKAVKDSEEAEELYRRTEANALAGKARANN
jgi:hypothetical protein